MDTAPLDYASSRTPRWIPKPSPWLVAGATLALTYFLLSLLYRGANVRAHGTQATLAAAMTDVSQLSNAIDLFHEDVGRVPTDAEGLAGLIGSPPPDAKRWRGPYLRRLSTDPWGRPYVYQSTPSSGSAAYSVRSAGPDGAHGTADDIASH